MVMGQGSRVQRRALSALSGGPKDREGNPLKSVTSSGDKSFMYTTVPETSDQHAREAANSVEKEGQFIVQHGGLALVSRLAEGQQDVEATLTTAWNVAKIGAGNPMTARQSQDIAAELLTAWANATGRHEIAPYYKPAAQKLAM